MYKLFLSSSFGKYVDASGTFVLDPKLKRIILVYHDRHRRVQIYKISYTYSEILNFYEYYYDLDLSGLKTLLVLDNKIQLRNVDIC